MVRFIFCLLVLSLIGLTSVFLLKDKLDMFSAENFNVNKFTGAMTSGKEKITDTFKKDDKTINEDNEKEEQQSSKADIYFVKIQGSAESYIPVKKNIEEDDDISRFEETIKALLDGPATIGKFQGLYSEIPPETKLIYVKKQNNAYVINLTDDFEFGGGTESISKRFMQLVLTSTNAANNRDVYLEINGQKVEMLGGEGMMIKQPLALNL